MQALTVSNLLFLLKDVIEGSELFSELWVRGEVSNYTQSRLGHRYFSLKDDTSALRSVLFRDDMPGESLTNGDTVLAHGRVSIYTQRGELQYVCDFVRPEGMGLLAAQFEELRRRLEAEGLFAFERKRPLPPFPRRIGIVTSPSGAALHDVINVLERRWPLAELVVSPATVQGELAAPQIVAAIQRLANQDDLDAVMVVRGGGANEDLHAFNDERVARAIYGCPLPVVTGIGHETDVTIADLVADVRAPTPSAAAEHTTPSQMDIQARIDSMIGSIRRQAFSAASEAAEVALARARTLDRNAPDIPELATTLATASAQMGRALTTKLDRHGNEHNLLQARMTALDPRATLRRGFAAVSQAGSGKPVTSVRHVSSGDRLTVAVLDGSFWTEVS